MESIIAKLLSDFEDGKMNRRQLIKSLALTATAVSAGSAAQTAAPAAAAAARAPQTSAASPSLFHVINVNHIGYSVPNYARCRDFYVKMCGMRVPFETGTQCYLQWGDPKSSAGVSTIHLSQSNQPDAKPVVGHIAYTIDNWDRDAAYRKLKANGYNPEADTKYGWTIHDSEGYMLQLQAKEFEEYNIDQCGGYMQGCPKK